MIPQPAMKLLDFIGDTETGRPAPEAYEVIYGHNQKKLTKKITHMTLKELQANQAGFTKAFGSSASGRYQIMRDTLHDLIRKLDLSLDRIFDAELQDFLGYNLLLRRGYEKYMENEMSINRFARELAKEWASFPVLERTAGAHRTVERGQSYYAGDGVNKALIKPEKLEKVLRSMFDPTPAPQPWSFWKWLRSLFGG